MIGTTFTLVFAFLPLLVLPGGSGMFIRSMPVAVVYTVTASLLVALTIMPFLASRVLGGHEPAEGNRLLRGLQKLIHTTYRPLLHHCMQHRVATIVAAAVLFVASLGLVPVLACRCFPPRAFRSFWCRRSCPKARA